MTHGKTVGSCGHVITQCRCMDGHDNVVTISALCAGCQRKANEALLVAHCHAWKDGQHCFIAYYEHPGLNDGDAKVMSTHGIGPAACKRCLCGMEVKRA